MSVLDTLLQATKNKISQTAQRLFQPVQSFIQKNPTPASFIQKTFQPQISQVQQNVFKPIQNFGQQQSALMPQRIQSFKTGLNQGVQALGTQAESAARVYNWGNPITQAFASDKTKQDLGIPNVKQGKISSPIDLANATKFALTLWGASKMIPQSPLTNLVDLGAGALTGGAFNKLQGGSFSEGAGSMIPQTPMYTGAMDIGSKIVAPLTKFIAPQAVQQFGQYFKLLTNPEISSTAKGQIKYLIAKNLERVAPNAVKAMIDGSIGMGLVGATEPAKNVNQWLDNISKNAQMGGVFGGVTALGTPLVDLGFQGAKAKYNAIPNKEAGFISMPGMKVKDGEISLYNPDTKTYTPLTKEQYIKLDPEVKNISFSGTDRVHLNKTSELKGMKQVSLEEHANLSPNVKSTLEKTKLLTPSTGGEIPKRVNETVGQVPTLGENQPIGQKPLQVPSQAQYPTEGGADLSQQNLSKIEAKKIAQNLGLQGKPNEISTGEKPLGVVKTVQESPQTTQPLKKDIQGKYNVAGNKETLAAAEKRIATDAPNAYQFALQNHTAEGNATAILLAKQYEANGQPQMAADLMMQKAQQALKAGQGNQIYAMWDKLSPETVGATAARTIENYNAKAKVKIPALSAQQYQTFVDSAKQIATMGEGRDKNIATQALLTQIGQLIPSSISDKGIALWRTGLLTGFRTPGKILLSHTVSNLVEQAKNIPAAGVDIASSVFTGKRSLTPTLQGNLEGAQKGILAGVDNFIHGYNDPLSGGMAKDFTNQVNFGNSLLGKVAQKYVDQISRLHGSLYKPFFGAAHLNSLYDQALTEAGNQGLKGTALESFVKDFVASPPPDAAARALQEAQYTTFQNKTALGNIASGFTKSGGPLARVVAPFTQIPSSIAMKLIDYSPVGAVKTIIENIGKGNFDQRAFSQGLGRAITGTGIAAIGGALYAKGMMTLGYPTSKSEQALWKATGKIENAIKIGNTWRQLASFGPSGDALALGGNFVAGLMKDGIAGAGVQGLVGGIQTIASSPYLQGIETISAGLQDPAGKAMGILKSYLGSIVPTGIANIATATDQFQRQAPNAVAALKNKIPGLRQTNVPQQDFFGQPVARAQGLGGTLLDPTYGSNVLSTPITDELQRLQDSGNAVSLTPLTANQTILKQKVKLNPQQLYDLNAGSGGQLQSQLATLIQSSGYQSLDDELKAQAIDKIVQLVRTQYKNLNGTTITSGGTQTSVHQGVMIPIVNKNGNVTMIDTSFQPTKPTLTGLPELDKKAISKYNTDINSKISDIYDLFKAGQINVTDANSQIAELKAQTIKATSGVKVAKPTLKVLKIKKPKLAKIAKPKKTKVPKLAKIKPLKKNKVKTLKPMVLKPIKAVV